MEPLEVFRERCKWQLRVVKVRGGSEVRGVVLSEGPFWYATHWFGDRQYLCARNEDGGCVGCLEQAPRVMGCVLFDQEVGQERRPGLLEFSAVSWQRVEFMQLAGEFETVLGLQLVARRGRGRSPLRFVVGEQTTVQVPLPIRSWQRQANALAVLYRLPLVSAASSWADWVLSTQEQRNSAMGRALRAIAG